MTQIFFLDHDIRLIELLRIETTSDYSYWQGRANGQADCLKETIDYEPYELTDYEGEKQSD